jgi:predicted MFS family arabinose efflux permease
VSATFAASLVISPSLGTLIIDYTENGERNVVILATVVSVLNLLFIVFCVPESLPESVRKASWGSSISCEQADPFASLRKVGTNPGLLRICGVVMLSYLPEAGQYSCFFLYLKQIINFTNEEVAIFIAILCILSVVAQTIVLSSLMQYFGYKKSIIIGLAFQVTQLMIYGLYTTKIIMGVAGILAAMSSITYPAVSALVSKNADADQQGVTLGILTGIRGLCMGLGPALYGTLFYMFHVDLGDKTPTNQTISSLAIPRAPDNQHLHGVPFLVGAGLVFIAIWVAVSLKSDKNSRLDRKDSSIQLQPLTDEQKSPGGITFIETRHRFGSDQEVTVTVTTQTL